MAQDNISQNDINQNVIAQKKNFHYIVASNDSLVSHSKQKIKPILDISDEDVLSLLGRKTCLELGLIERIMNLHQNDCGNESGAVILNQYLLIQLKNITLKLTPT